MIGKINAHSPRLVTDESGNLELSLIIRPEYRSAARQLVKELKGKEAFSVAFSEQKKPRSLDQNALMWQLLTIYAKAEGGGRTGNVTPEEIYYRTLARYGVAEHLIIPAAAVEGLKRAYRGVEVIDNATVEINGKKRAGKLVKCVLGSSNYSTTEMSHVIDGLFDELAKIGVDVPTSREVASLLNDWRGRNDKSP